MARTPSVMIDLGTKAPEFSLLEPLTGKTISLTDFKAKPVLIAFFCNHCPYVVHIRDEFTRFVKEFSAKGLVVIAINSNDIENYPDDSPEKMIESIKKHSLSYPYLYDETQSVAKAYRAACTPDFYLFDTNHELYYRGQFDGSRPRNDEPVTGVDMIAAATLLLENKAAPTEQLASLGCNIKWKLGNEPQ
ncbi:MAG TPA: thioredoxin family protein [Leucothrix mucor]|nr:thioredoxin family protein [Leucothrix mucor]